MGLYCQQKILKFHQGSKDPLMLSFKSFCIFEALLKKNKRLLKTKCSKSSKRAKYTYGLYHLDCASHRRQYKASQAGRSPGLHFIRTLSAFPEGKLHFQNRNPNLPVAKTF